MRNYFLSHVFDRDGDGAGDPPAPPAGGGATPGQSPADPPAGTPASAVAAAPPKPPKQRSDAEVFQGRIDGLTRERTEYKTRAEKAENELRAARELLERQAAPAPKKEGEADPAAGDPPAPPAKRPAARAPTLDDLLSTEEGQKAVTVRAQQIAQARQIEQRGDEIYDQAVGLYGEAKLDKALSNFKAFDGMRPDLADAIFELENAPAVLYEIASKPATIERLYGMTPARMGAAVAALALTVKAPVKNSRAPEPPENIGGRGNAGPVRATDDNVPMADWVKAREADLKARGVRL